jgi:RND family efflux transporter MFP subunit
MESPLASCRRGWRSLSAIAVGIALAGCGVQGGLDSSVGGEEQAVPAVEAVPARHGSLPQEELVSGVVRARNQVAVRPEISATVVEVLARNGDRVEAGQPLVRLNDDTFEEQLRQAEASFRLAQATAAEIRARLAEVTAQILRDRVLARDGLISPLELETREAQLDAAEARASQAAARVEQTRAEVAERRSALAKTLVRSPVAGRVGQRDVEVGMVVGPASTLFLVGDFDDLIVEIPLTQGMLERVAEGTPVAIETRSAASEPLYASVSRISPFLEPSSFSTVAEIDVAASGGAALRPGMFVTVRLLYGSSEQATLIPSSALWEDPRRGVRSVFVVEQSDGLQEPAGTAVGTEIPERGHPVRREAVEFLAEGRGMVGVRGIEEGQWVVTLGQHLLNEAMEAEDTDTTTARVRPTSWEKVLGLQALQREDLLETFLEKQRRLARLLGAEIPESEERVEELLGQSRDEPVDGASSAPDAGR